MAKGGKAVLKGGRGEAERAAGHGRGRRCTPRRQRATYLYLVPCNIKGKRMEGFLLSRDGENSTTPHEEGGGRAKEGERKKG